MRSNRNNMLLLYAHAQFQLLVSDSDSCWYLTHEQPDQLTVPVYQRLWQLGSSVDSSRRPTADSFFTHAQQGILGVRVLLPGGQKWKLALRRRMKKWMGVEGMMVMKWLRGRAQTLPQKGGQMGMMAGGRKKRRQGSLLLLQHVIAVADNDIRE